MKRSFLLLVLLALATPARAQLATPEARSFALGGAYTARATGYEASFWNPANLGLSTNPAWSAGANASMYFSNNALDYGRVTGLYGEYLDAAEKSRLLEDVRAATGGGLAQLSFDVGAQGVGVSFGRFAAGLAGIGAGDARITPDALELLLFGNVGQDGTGRDFDFSGTRADLWSLYGGYASFAQPFTLDRVAGARFSAGATLRYGVAGDLLRVTETQSELIYEPLSLDVALQKLDSSGGNAGRAFAADLGLAVEWEGRLVAGMSLVNAIQVVSWERSNFAVTSYQVQADYENISSTSTTVAYDDLDGSARDRVDALLEEADLPRELRFGSLYRASPRWDVSADYVERIGGSLRSRWDRSLSAGAEFRALPVLPLRAGLATSFDQFALTAGLGLHTGPVHLDFAIGRWGLGGGDGLVSALALSLWP